MTELAQAVQILTPTIPMVGASIVWLWNRIEKRLEQRFEYIDQELAKSRREHEKCRKREDLSTERRAHLITIIELLWRAVDREAPESPELQRVQKLMDDYKAIGARDDDEDQV